MPIRPEIALAAQTADLTKVLPLFQQARQASQQNQLFPLQQQALEQQVQQQQFQGSQEREQALQQSVMQGSLILERFVDAGDFEGAMRNLQERRASLQRQGLPTETTDSGIQLLQENPEEFSRNIKNIAAAARQSGGQRPVQFGTGRRVVRTDIDPETGEEVQVAGESITVRDPNTGQVTSQFIPVEGEFVSTLGETAEEQTERRVREAGERESVTLEAKAKGLGAVKRAEFLASNRPDIAADFDLSTDILADIDRAIEIWETAPGTISGPAASRLPALRAETQELESILARLGIDRLANFKGATSERELATAFRAGASIEQNAEAGIRRLERQRETVNRARRRQQKLLREADVAIGSDDSPQQFEGSLEDLSDEDLLNF